MVDIWSYFDLAQPACLVCGMASGGRGLLCAGCRQDLPRAPPGCLRCALPLPGGATADCCTACLADPPALRRTVAALSYAFPVDVLVQQLKFGGRLPVARALGELLLDPVRTVCYEAGRPQALLPVPLHPSRQRERGYNQAERIAMPVSRALGIPLRTDALVRQRATVAQSGIDLRQRQTNLHDAFRVSGALPAHVAIIDDVVTSGSTLRAVAGTLAAAGVTRIDAWVVARTL